MGVQKVMSRSGHDEYAFDKADRLSTEEATRRFEELSKSGVWIDTDKGVVMKRFDPNVESMRYQPHLVGG